MTDGRRKKDAERRREELARHRAIKILRDVGLCGFTIPAGDGYPEGYRPERACILEKGHDGGMHEPAPEPAIDVDADLDGPLAKEILGITVRPGPPPEGSSRVRAIVFRPSATLYQGPDGHFYLEGKKS